MMVNTAFGGIIEQFSQILSMLDFTPYLYIMPINQAERAHRTWPILTARAREGNTITYGDLGALLGVHHRAIRYVLGLIQAYCLEEKLPPLTILVVDQSGKPGTGFIAYDVDKLAEGVSLVYAYNWGAISNPFAFAADGTTYEEIVSELAGNPSAAADVMRMVKTRGVAQALFRDALLRVYQNRCAFTGISFRSVLDACHIVPWSMCSPEERLDVRNGLLLNSIHHKLFDEGSLTLTPDLRIWYAVPDLKKRSYSEYDSCRLSSTVSQCKCQNPIRSDRQKAIFYAAMNYMGGNRACPNEKQRIVGTEYSFCRRRLGSVEIVSAGFVGSNAT